MIDKRPKHRVMRGGILAVFHGREAAWSDGALHHYLSRAD